MSLEPLISHHRAPRVVVVQAVALVSLAATAPRARRGGLFRTRAVFSGFPPKNTRARRSSATSALRPRRDRPEPTESDLTRSHPHRRDGAGALAAASDSSALTGSGGTAKVRVTEIFTSPPSRSARLGTNVFSRSTFFRSPIRARRLRARRERPALPRTARSDVRADVFSFRDRTPTRHSSSLCPRWCRA